MTPFWMGAIWASLFWVLAYCAAVVSWAIWDIRQRGAEMMNTEAANDRVGYWRATDGGFGEKRPDPLADVNGRLA
jgi:hypothetical protein